MEDVPTIWDFLAYQSGQTSPSTGDWRDSDWRYDTGFSMSDYGDISLEDKEGKIGGYLQNLLLESGKFGDSDDIESIFKTFEEGYDDPMFWKGKGFEGFNIEDIYRSKDFQNMSKDDMENWFFENMFGADYTLGLADQDIMQAQYDKFWEESEGKDTLFDFLEGMQEGFGSMKTFGEYGGVDKIRDIEKSTQSDISSAYSKYIPREIKSRYGSLQGKGGESGGEIAEHQYLSELASLDRRKGRGIKTIYEDYEEGLFEDLESWLS